MVHSVRRLIGNLDHFCWLAPDPTLTVGTSRYVFLMVNAPEENVAADPHGKDGKAVRILKDNRVDGEVLGLERVHGWEPDKGAPCEVEAEVIMADVNGAEIPVLINEEVEDVDGVKSCAEEDRVGNVAVELVLVGDKRQVTSSVNIDFMRCAR